MSPAAASPAAAVAAAVEELSRGDRRRIEGALELAQEAVHRAAGHRLLLLGDLEDIRAARLEACDEAELARDAAQRALAAPAAALGAAESALAEAEALAGLVQQDAASPDLQTRVRAKAEAQVLASEVAELTRRRDNARGVLASAQAQVAAADRRITATDAALDEADAALADPFGHPLKYGTAAWQLVMAATWQQHLGQADAHTPEGRFALSVLDVLLRQTGRGAEIERNAIAGRTAELGQDSPVQELPGGGHIVAPRALAPAQVARARGPVPNGTIDGPPEQRRAGFEVGPGLPGAGAPGWIGK